MSNADVAACPLRHSHYTMWVCASCGFRALAAGPHDLESAPLPSPSALPPDWEAIMAADLREHPACDLCRRIDGHDPTCLRGDGYREFWEGRHDPDAPLATSDRPGE